MTGADRRAEGGERFIGNYRVTRLLSEGGMGVVYAAEHRLLGRPAAIKLLLDQYSRNPQIVQRFFTEARAATAIRHPGIVEIYDFGHQDDGSAYIAMELLEGEDLDTRVRRLGRLHVGQAIHMAMQIASALAAAHAHGVVHRDLKPANIFLVPDPQVVGGERIKLLDFGIAKVAASEADAVADAGARTQAGLVMGTPSYMAPEQCLGAALVDARADLYAVGCILFEMVCGRAPFAGASGMDIIAAHLRQSPPRPRELVPEVPVELEALILLLLEKDPARRPQTAAELEAALGVLLVQGAAAVLPGVPPPRPARGGRALLLVLAGCAIVGAVVAAAWPSSPPPRPPVVIAPAPPPPAPPPEPLRFAPVDAEAAPADPALARWVLRSTPPGAQVLYRDEVVGETPLAAAMPRDPARTETVRIHLYDHVDQDVELAATGGGEREVALVPYVKIAFLSRPAGAVIHAPNGETIGVTPGEIGVPPGADAVTFVLRKDGYQDHEARVVPDKSQKLRITLERVTRSRAASDKETR
jgi:tRNA A-37 threonylcarbamoyl transferase component Bud32